MILLLALSSFGIVHGESPECLMSNGLLKDIGSPCGQGCGVCDVRADCQPLSNGISCRSAFDACDVEELCDGSSIDWSVVGRIVELSCSAHRATQQQTIKTKTKTKTTTALPTALRLRRCDATRSRATDAQLIATASPNIVQAFFLSSADRRRVRATNRNSRAARGRRFVRPTRSSQIMLNAYRRRATAVRSFRVSFRVSLFLAFRVCSRISRASQSCATRSATECRKTARAARRRGLQTRRYR